MHCSQCNRKLTSRTAVLTTELDLWGQPMQVQLCYECYSGRQERREPVNQTQPSLPGLEGEK
jgi:hypothetical protein